MWQFFADAGTGTVFSGYNCYRHLPVQKTCASLQKIWTVEKYFLVVLKAMVFYSKKLFSANAKRANFLANLISMGYQFHFELLNEGPLDFSGQLHPCDAMKKKNLCREERKTERKKEDI